MIEDYDNPMPLISDSAPITGTYAAFLKATAAVCRWFLRSKLFGRATWLFVPVFRRHFLPDVEIETVYCGNVRFVARLNDHIESQIFWQGVQEGDRGEFALLLRELRPDSVLFDIGANVGVVTLAAASRSPLGIIHSFEPWPLHLERLSANILLNGFRNIHVNAFALGKKKHTGVLHVIDPVNTGMATLYPGDSSVRDQPNAQSRITCRVLDDYVRETSVTRVDMIKIDVEGAELEVLQGGQNTLERFRPKIFMELNLDLLARAGASAVAVFELLRSYGYSIARIGHDAELVPLEGPENLVINQNVYCKVE